MLRVTDIDSRTKYNVQSPLISQKKTFAINVEEGVSVPPGSSTKTTLGAGVTTNRAVSNEGARTAITTGIPTPQNTKELLKL